MHHNKQGQNKEILTKKDEENKYSSERNNEQRRRKRKLISEKVNKEMLYTTKLFSLYTG